MLVPLAAEYIRIRALALPAALVGAAAQAACLGAKDTRTPAASVALAAALNLCGDFVFVPRNGMAGAACATALSQLAAAALLCGVLRGKELLPDLVAPLRTLGRRLGARACQAITGRPRSCRRAKEARASAKREHVPSPRVVGRKRAALRRAGSSGAARVAPFFAFGSFIFCCMVKLLLHNSSSLTAASLGGADAAAHTVVMSVAMFCFVLGDVGSSLSQAFLSPFYRPSADGSHARSDGNGDDGAFDMEGVRPAITTVLRVSWTIAAVAVAASSLLISRGTAAFTADAGVAAAITRVLPMTALTLAMHSSAVTLEGLLLVQRRFPFLCGVYAGIGVATVALHRAILRTPGVGLGAIWAVYVGFQASRSLLFAWRAGLLSRPRAAAAL